MRCHAIHGAQEAVALDIEPLEQLQNGIDVGFRLHVGLQKPEKKEILSGLRSAKADGRVGYAQLAAALLHIEDGAVTGEVKESARPEQPAQFESVELGLQAGEHQRPHVADIDPGLKDGQRMRLPQFRHRLADFEGTDSHNLHPITRRRGLSEDCHRFCGGEPRDRPNEGGGFDWGGGHGGPCPSLER